MNHLLHCALDVPPGTPGDHTSTGIWILAAALTGTALALALARKKK